MHLEAYKALPPTLTRAQREPKDPSAARKAALAEKARLEAEQAEIADLDQRERELREAIRNHELNRMIREREEVERRRHMLERSVASRIGRADASLRRNAHPAIGGTLQMLKDRWNADRQTSVIGKKLRQHEAYLAALKNAIAECEALLVADYGDPLAELERIIKPFGFSVYDPSAAPKLERRRAPFDPPLEDE